MKCANICKGSHVLMILKSLIFISLGAIFYNFYFTDVVNKFAEKDTTLINSQETIKENEIYNEQVVWCNAVKSVHVRTQYISSGAI